MPKKHWIDRAMNGEPTIPPPEFRWAMQSIDRLGYKETMDGYDWVPTNEAYKRYVKDWEEKTAEAAEHRRPRLLTRDELGTVLRVMFPEADKVTRRRAGKPTRGFAGIKGPGAERTPPEEDAWKRRKDLGLQR